MLDNKTQTKYLGPSSNFIFKLYDFLSSSAIVNIDFFTSDTEVMKNP